MQDKIRYELTAHAATVMAERKIPAAWVERVLQSPGRTEPDKVDPELRHAWAASPSMMTGYCGESIM